VLLLSFEAGALSIQPWLHSIQRFINTAWQRKGDGLGLAADGLSQEAARTTAPVFIVGWGFHGQNTEAPSRGL
jgi:hypothetical protein